MEIPQRGGLPHSDIHGSKPARGSPWLFAACHVLHRLLVPRHPPNALLSLKIVRHIFQCAPHHAQKPSSVINAPCPVTSRSSQTNQTQNTRRQSQEQIRDGSSRRSAHNKSPLNTRHPTAGALIPCETALPVRHATEQRTVAQPRHRSPDNVRRQYPTTGN
jgi:hypothetical protein